VAQFPPLKARRLLAVLQREPLAYDIARQRGSHRLLVSRRGYPSFVFAFHDRATVSPGAVRATLVTRVGLAEQEALRLL
jgi:predicted RNA binding protein YcfA (HicA-like mRNA interferase family)